MEFRILGTVEVEGEDGPLPVGGPRQRAVLAELLLHANRVVARDALIHAVWGEDAPDTAATALHGHVSALRKALGNDRIVTRPPGYALQVDDDAVDVLRFNRLVRDGEAALAADDPAHAADALRAALGLWRGEALADLEPVAFVEDERRRLDESRLAALELRIDADLALGRQAALVAELGDLVRANPLRERLRSQLMLALYRSGRQAEALDAYAEGRRLLASELGLEPGDELRELQRSILEHDPAIAGPAPRHAAPRRRRYALAAGVVVAVAAAAGSIALTRGGTATVSVAPDSVAIVDPGSNRVVADIRLDSRPESVAVGFGAAWVAEPRSRTIARIDAGTHRVDVFGVNSPAHDLAVGLGYVWSADGDAGTVSRIDPRSMEVDKTIPLGGQPVRWVATSESAVWVGRPHDVVRFKSDGTAVRRFRVDSTTGLVAAGGIVRILGSQASSPISLTAPDTAWASTASNDLIRLDTSGSTEEATLGGSALAPVVDHGTVWVIAYLGAGAIVPVDGASLSIERPVALDYPVALAAGEGGVWAVGAQGTLTRIDPTTRRVVARIATAPTLRAAVATGAGLVWVAVQNAS